MPVEVVGLRKRQVDLGAVLQAEAVALQPLIGGRLVGAAAVAGVDLRHQPRHLGRQVELIIAQLRHRPEGDLVLVGDVGGVLLGENIGIGTRAGSTAVDVDQRLGAEQAVDVACLGGHCSGHGRLLRITGGAQQIGDDAQQGQAQLHILHRGGDVRCGDGGRLDLVVGDVYLLGIIGAAGRQQLHYQMLAAVIGVIVGAGHIGRAGTAGRLDDQRGIVDGRDGKLHLVLRHRNISRGRRLLCGGDIQNIAENDRLAGEQLEVRIHEFAERVGCPVVGVAQLLHRLRPAGAENRGAGGSRLIRRLNRSQTDHEGDARTPPRQGC